MKKVISYCLYGNKDFYCLGLIENINIINKYYSDWGIYIYYNNIPDNILNILKVKKNCKLIECKSYGYLWEGMFWRWLPLDDETVDFWIENNAEIDPFICTPYVGSPIYYDNKDYLLQQYDSRLKLVAEGKAQVNEETMKKWKLEAEDKFMTECGDALKYTATVSQYFTIPELFALKEFMYKHDTRRMLQMAHQKFDETGLEQWKHDKKWEKYCEVCHAHNELTLKISL